MAKNNHEVAITGSTAGLSTATKQAEKLLDGVSKQAMSLNGIMGTLGNGLKGAGGLSPAFMALGGAMGVATAALALFTSAAGQANEIDQLALKSGLASDAIQQLAHGFGDAGMQMSDFAAMNKDAVKNLGEAVATGGGVGEDLKKYGLDLKNFTQYIGDSNGGVKASIGLFYQMRDAGASIPEITASMEKLAGGSSNMISELQKLNDEGEAWNMINGQNVDVNSDAIESYREFSRRMGDFTVKMQGALANGLTPLVNKTIELYDWFEKDWNNTTLGKVFDNMGKSIDSVMSGGDSVDSSEKKNTQRKTAAQLEAEANEQRIKERKKFIEEQARLTQTEIKTAVDQENAFQVQQAANKKINDRLAAEAAAAKEKADKEAARNAERNAKELARIAEAARKEQERLAKEAEQTRLNNITSLDALNISALSREAASMASQRNQMQTNLDKVKELYDKGVINADEFERRKVDLYASYKENFGDSVSGITDPEELYKAMDATQQVYQQELLNLQSQLDAKLITQQSYQDKLALLEDENRDRKAMLDAQADKVRMSSFQTTMNGMGDLLTAFGGKNSKAAQAAFAVSKGLAIAQGMIDAQKAASNALANNPYPWSIAMAAAAYGQVAANIVSIKGTKGQFHDGIDNVPSTGTYLLEKGERVVDKRLNDDLKTYLKGDATEQPITVNAPLNINGSVNSADRMVMDAINRHAQNIERKLEDARRRKM